MDRSKYVIDQTSKIASERLFNSNCKTPDSVPVARARLHESASIDDYRREAARDAIDRRLPVGSEPSTFDGLVSRSCL